MRLSHAGATFRNSRGAGNTGPARQRLSKLPLGFGREPGIPTTPAAPTNLTRFSTRGWDARARGQIRTARLAPACKRIGLRVRARTPRRHLPLRGTDRGSRPRVGGDARAGALEAPLCRDCGFKRQLPECGPRVEQEGSRRPHGRYFGAVTRRGLPGSHLPPPPPPSG